MGSVVRFPVTSFTPGETSFNLTPHENHTIAIRVTAPSNVAAGTQGQFEIKMSYSERPNDPTGKIVDRYMNFNGQVIQARAITVTRARRRMAAPPCNTAATP